jgi:hypothetical protein
MAKIRVMVFVKPKADSTKYLVKHIGKHIDNLNKILIINIIQVTKSNLSEVKAMGVTRTPTLVYNKKLYVTLEKIIRILTPPQNAKETYGPGIEDPEDLIRRYHSGVIDSDDSPGDGDEKELRQDDIMRKMAAFQKRRPQMEGVPEKARLRGGRKVVARHKKDKFNSDDAFRKESGVDEAEETPGFGHHEYDGPSMLEDYYNREADNFGRKRNDKPIRWSQH